MEAKLPTDQILQNYFFRIGDGYLFIRSETADKFNNLVRGDQKPKVVLREYNVRGTSIKDLLDTKELTDTYNLPQNFDFDFDSKVYEFVVLENVYQDIKKNLSDILESDSKATFENIIHSKFIRRRNTPANKKSKVGRQKVYKDQATGEIIGMKPENKTIFDLWESGTDYESIRFAINPKTKSSPKKSAEISTIKRKLRKYRHLLTRKYVRK